MQIKLELEVWVDIQNYENYYQISNFGRVKALSRKLNFTTRNGKSCLRLTNERILKYKKIRGYNCVTLSKNDNPKNLRVCRLVAIHFIDNPYKKSQVNHIDGNKRNDNLSNLEWVTPKENMKHAYENNLLKIYRGGERVNAIKVICTITNKIYDTIGHAAIENNISQSHLSRVLRGIKYKNKTTLKIYNA
jgi:hypothetical protein